MRTQLANLRYYARIIQRGNNNRQPVNLAIAKGNMAWASPIWVKVSPVGCQSKITGLLKEGEPLLEFAMEAYYARGG